MTTKIKKYKVTPKYSWGGVLADAAAGAGTGALAGSAVPGIGTAVGAIIGGAGALIKGAAGEIAGNKQEKLELAQQRIAQANNSFNTMMGNGIQNPFTATFAMGGRVGNINAEIEKGETALSPDGTMHKFQLPSHANSVGDNFKSFDPGTMIFSDKLKFSKNKTFAQEQNRWLKLSAKADKTIKNPGSTFLNKKTANLNKQNSLKMSVDLFGKQEAMKMSKGGSVPGKFPDGGKVPWWQQGPFYPGSGFTASGIPYPSQDNTFKAMTYNVRPGTYNNPNQLGQVNVQANATPIQQPQSDWRFYEAGNKPRNFVKSGFDPLNPMGIIDIPAAQPIIKSSAAKTNLQNGGTRGTSVASAQDDFIASQMELMKYNAPTSPDMNIDINAAMAATDAAQTASPVNYAGLANQFDQMGVQPLGRPKTDWGGIGMQALALAPDIYNLGHALFSKPEKIARNRYFNPYTNQIRSRMNDRRFNIDPILAGNRNANAVYNRNVSNASGGDRSRLLSNLMGGLQARYGADANAYSQKNNMDNQYLGQQAEMDYNLGAMNAQALGMSDDINARNLAAKRNFGASAASGMQRYALNQMQMNNQMNSQNAYLDVLQRVNPFFNQWLGINDLRNYNKR